jgi:hypothetical protein
VLHISDGVKAISIIVVVRQIQGQVFRKCERKFSVA